MPVRADAPAARTLAGSPVAHAAVGDVVRISVDGLPASSRVTVDIRVGGTWHRLGTANTGRLGRTTLPAFTSDAPGTFPLRIRSQGNPNLFVQVMVAS